MVAILSKVEPSERIYQIYPFLNFTETSCTIATRKRALRLSLDPTNLISNFIDIGNGAGDERLPFPMLDQREHPLYYRNFYRLSPSLTIKANGELATCRLLQAGEGYGKIHERPRVEILNHFDEAFVHQLHASRQLEKYLPLVDRSLFGSAFTHLCSLRSIVTLLARKMHERGVSPDEASAVQHLNLEVAALTGHASPPAQALENESHAKF